ncbi:MFS transporter [Bacillus dakarensis]|uniref:MFS transporter n=1 Tax=Robertmurraya dakarensis TaxID=1926278 RepID=UPI00098153AC|nr:MFS transporter [Bacillus dakarensis]
MVADKKMWVYSGIGLLIAAVVIAFARLSYGVVLPFMKDGLNITYSQAGYLGTTTSLGYLCMVIFAGMAAAKWGSKVTILSGVSLVTVGFIGLTFSSSYWITFLFMLLLGVGTAFTYTPLISWLVAWFPHKKGTMIGITTSGVGIGLLTTGILVPYLETVFTGYGWRVAWGLFALVAFIVVILAFVIMKDPPSTKKSEHMQDTASTKEIFLNPNVIKIAVLYGILGMTYIIHAVFIMSYMIESGVDITIAGQLMAINGILSIFCGPIWGVVSDKLGRRISLILTAGITSFSMLIPIFFTSMPGFIMHMLILSCTLNGLFTLIQASSMDFVKPVEMPIAFSYATFYYAVGQFLGPTIGGWLIDEWGGFKSAFLFCSIVLGVGFILAFTVKKAETFQNPVPQKSIQM